MKIPHGTPTAQCLQRQGADSTRLAPTDAPKQPPATPQPHHPSLGASLSKKPLETNTCSSQASQEVVKRELQAQPHPYVAFIASQYSQFFFLP